MDQIVGGGLLDQVARGASLGELMHVFVVTVGREDEHFAGQALLDDLARGLEPVQLRHGDIHDDDIRGELLRHVDGLAAIFGLADHFDVGFGGKEGTDSLAHDRMVVG